MIIKHSDIKTGPTIRIFLIPLLRTNESPNLFISLRFIFWYPDIPISRFPVLPISPSPYPSISPSPNHPASPSEFMVPLKIRKLSNRSVLSHRLTSQDRWIPDDHGRYEFFYNPMRKSPMLESLFDGRGNDRFRTQRNIDQYPFLLLFLKAPGSSACLGKRGVNRTPNQKKFLLLRFTPKGIQRKHSLYLCKREKRLIHKVTGPP